MNDSKTSPSSPTSPAGNGRRPLKRSPRRSSFKRRSAPGSLLVKASISEETVIGNQDMAASFLQYCAMCEKQILTPSNSILYCSDACRRKDSCKPLALATAALSPPSTPPSSAPSSPRPILPSRSRTGTTSVLAPLTRMPVDLYHSESDLDPTEWKPKIQRRGESEAFRYLSQFHRSTSAVVTPDEHDPKPAPRPRLAQRSTTSAARMAMPSLSLSQTPTSASSSLSIAAEYDFMTRPLQTRHNPTHSASASATRGIDLVMPYVAPSVATSLPRPDEDDKYEKKMGDDGIWFGV